MRSHTADLAVYCCDCCTVEIRNHHLRFNAVLHDVVTLYHRINTTRAEVEFSVDAMLLSGGWANPVIFELHSSLQTMHRMVASALVYEPMLMDPPTRYPRPPSDLLSYAYLAQKACGEVPYNHRRRPLNNHHRISPVCAPHGRNQRFPPT